MPSCIRIAVLAACAVIASGCLAAAEPDGPIYCGNDDGAKAEECVIQVWGIGPATSTPAEKR